MSVHSAITHHIIEYAKSRVGEEIISKILSGVDCEFPILTSLRNRISFADVRRITENFYSIFKEKEFYYLGKDFVSCFNEHKEFNKDFPLISMIEIMPSMSKMDRQTFQIFLGIASQINSAHNFKLKKYSSGLAEISCIKNPMYDSKGIKFKLPDSKFIDIACENHKGSLDEALKLLRAENSKIEEIFHQGTNYDGFVLEHCLYRISWKSDYDEKAIETVIPYNMNKLMDFWDLCIKEGITIPDLRTVVMCGKGLKYREIAEIEKVSEQTIKSRIEKLRNIFGNVERVDVLIKIFRDKGYFDTLEYVGLKK